MTSPAWQRALAAPDDRGAWRVLADELISTGDPRGEWLQLELDAEEAPLKGLARGRLTRLREEGLAFVLPAGVEPAHAKTWRGLLISARVQASRSVGAPDPKWRSVRNLSFFVESRWPTVEQWKKTPLGGEDLHWLEGVSELELEGLRVLAAGPAWPRLTRVWALWPTGRVPSVPSWEFVSTWRAVLERQVGVRDVHVDWAPPIDQANAFLRPLLDQRLTRFAVSGGPSAVVDYDAWVRGTGFAGEFVVELRQASLLRASVVVGRGVLVLRAEPRVAEEARQSVLRAYRERGLNAQVRVEPRVKEMELVPPPR